MSDPKPIPKKPAGNPEKDNNRDAPLTPKTIFFCSLLMIYLLVIGGFAVYTLIFNFPASGDSELIFPNVDDLKRPEIKPFGAVGSKSNAMLILVFMAGIAGSFIHTAQSLSSYIGNKRFVPSWILWYFLRPWIGGVLAIAVYIVIKGGLASSIDTENPYGVISLGLLGGWFSKAATDKLREVFDTLFHTNADKERKNKLTEEEENGIDSDNAK